MDPSLLKRRLRAATVALLATAAALLAPGLVHEARAGSDSLTVTITPRDVWPPAPVADLVGSAGAEGQMLLQWTAPDSNDNVFAALTAAAGYEIRVATFSVVSIGGSTTTWWNAATEVRSLASPSTPPTPAVPGTLQSLLLNALSPGATYYAALRSSDTVGNWSALDTKAALATQANALVYDAVPAAPATITASAVGDTQIDLSWPASSAYDKDFYRIYVDSTAPYDFADAWIVPVDTPTLAHSLVGVSTGTYAFRVTTVDIGAPTGPGYALESVTVTSTTLTLLPVVRLPQAPFGVSITTVGTNATLQWMPVVRYADLTPFADPSNAKNNELNSFRIDRATVPYGGVWSPVALVSSATLTWTDLASGPGYHYTIISRNSYGDSDRSVVRSVGSRSAYVVASDAVSHFEILRPDVLPVEGVTGQPMTAYLIGVSSHPEDLGGRVIKSMEIWARQGGQSLTPNFSIEGLGRLRMHYDWSGTSVTPSAFAAGVAPTQENMAVYWYNGARWMQLYGDLDTLTQTMSIETKYIGRYQLRTVERAEGFRFDNTGVSNRMISPNGDGKNDDVVFNYDNPRDAAVRIRILDLHGRVLVHELPPGPVSNSRRWDARAGGGIVPSGVYIYQIEADGRSFSGTLVIIR